MPLQFWIYLIALAGGAAVGAWFTHRWDGNRYATLQAQYATYRAQVARDTADAAVVATAALQAQSALRAAAETRNAQILAQYEDQSRRAGDAERDRDIARGLLGAACAPVPAGSGSHPLPETSDRPGTHAAYAASGDKRAVTVFGLTAAAVDDCREAVRRLDGLQQELAPQL